MKHKTIAVPISTCVHIRRMFEDLKAEFGVDFSFTIMAQGHIVAAHNNKHGDIRPTIKT